MTGSISALRKGSITCSGVMSLVGEQRVGALQIMRLSGREMKAGRIAPRVAG